MLVIMVTDDYLPRIGGIAAHIYHLSKALIKAGCQVRVLHAVSEGTGTGRQLVEEEAGSLPVCRLRTGAHRPGWMRHFDILWALQVMKNQKGEIAIVHQHDYLYSSRAVYWFTKLAGSKWVWTNHSSMFLMAVRQGTFSGRARNLHSRMHGCIAVSREILEVSRTVWENASIVMDYIPNGVDMEMFTPSGNDCAESAPKAGKPFVVLCPRRIAPKNGVIYFAKAADVLSSKYPDVDWRFWVTGHMYQGSEYAQQILEALERPLLAGQVAFLGAVPHHKMPTVYRRADLVVIPSLVEAVSLSALEAMASGIPVVATSVGGLPEVVKDGYTGILVPPEDAEAIADAVWKVYVHREWASTLAMNAYEMVAREYAWANIAQRTMNFYAKVLKVA